MSRLFSIFDDDDNRKEGTDTEDTRSLKLRKEELDINKSKIMAGDVELGKEIIEEQKTVEVPITHEEVVIERKTLNNEASDSPISDEEIIHIPVTEEHIDVSKHTVVTGEVTAHKREVTETRRVDESLKREEARIHSTGNANIIDTNTDDSFH